MYIGEEIIFQNREKKKKKLWRCLIDKFTNSKTTTDGLPGGLVADGIIFFM